MNKLSKEKRDQILVTALGTMMVLAAIWMLLISPQQDSINKVRKDMGAKQNQLDEMVGAIQKADATSNELNNVTATLSDAESDMASNDPNAWIYDLIRHFKEHYKVDISVGGQTSVGDVDLIPGTPYKQLRVSVSGTAFYHDLGNFIANFENTFPHIRIVNLSLDPVEGNGDSAEKLNFHMDIVTLIKQD